MSIPTSTCCELPRSQPPGRVLRTPPVRTAPRGPFACSICCKSDGRGRLPHMSSQNTIGAALHEVSSSGNSSLAGLRQRGFGCVQDVRQVVLDRWSRAVVATLESSVNSSVSWVSCATRLTSKRPPQDWNAAATGKPITRLAAVHHVRMDHPEVLGQAPQGIQTYGKWPLNGFLSARSTLARASRPGSGAERDSSFLSWAPVPPG
jgi:hypothetical protein